MDSTNGALSLSIKREAAYHEAGHAVVASLAVYHGLAGPIDLKAYGAGSADIGLLKSKCALANVQAHEETAKLPEVAKDLGRILVAGLIAEQIASVHDNSIVPNAACANPDHEMLRRHLSNAGLSKKFDFLETESRKILEENWRAVEVLATMLYAQGSADLEQIKAAIQSADCP